MSRLTGYDLGPATQASMQHRHWSLRSLRWLCQLVVSGAAEQGFSQSQRYTQRLAGSMPGSYSTVCTSNQIGSR